jgi:putative transposase
MNQMLINVSTRRFRHSVRLPDGDVASTKGDGTSKSAVVRGAVEHETEGLAGERSVVSGPAGDPDLHLQEDLILVAGIDATGEKHPLGLVEGATENAATVQALLDNLVELDPAVVRLFIIDGAKALSKAIRRTFGRNTPIQRCQVHKARNIAERLPKEAHARGSPAGLGDGGGPSSGSGTWRAGWTRSGPASPPPSWRDWMRSCVSCPGNYVALWPAPTSSRT